MPRQITNLDVVHHYSRDTAPNARCFVPINDFLNKEGIPFSLLQTVLRDGWQEACRGLEEQLLRTTALLREAPSDHVARRLEFLNYLRTFLSVENMGHILALTEIQACGGSAGGGTCSCETCEKDRNGARFLHAAAGLTIPMIVSGRWRRG